VGSFHSLRPLRPLPFSLSLDYAAFYFLRNFSGRVQVTFHSQASQDVESECVRDSSSATSRDSEEEGGCHGLGGGRFKSDSESFTHFQERNSGTLSAPLAVCVCVCVRACVRGVIAYKSVLVCARVRLCEKVCALLRVRVRVRVRTTHTRAS